MRRIVGIHLQRAVIDIARDRLRAGPHHSFGRRDERVRRNDPLVAAPDAGITHDDKPVTELALTTDAVEDTTLLKSGSLTFFAIERSGKLGVRVRDADPDRAARLLQRLGEHEAATVAQLLAAGGWSPERNEAGPWLRLWAQLAAIRNGQRLTTMTSGQARFPIAPSKYKFSPAGKCGMWMNTELLPNLAKNADDICWMRSLNTEAINHEPAICAMQTGNQIAGRPCLGSWASYGLGSANDNLPSFVVLIATPTNRDQEQAISSRLWSSGYLPGEHAGVSFGEVGKAFTNTSLRDDLVARIVKQGEKLVAETGADVIVPGEMPLNILLATHGVTEVDGAPIMDGIAVTLKMTEMQVSLRRSTGLGQSRRGWMNEQPQRERVNQVLSFYGLDH